MCARYVDSVCLFFIFCMVVMYGMCVCIVRHLSVLSYVCMLCDVRLWVYVCVHFCVRLSVVMYEQLVAYVCMYDMYVCMLDMICYVM